MVDETKSFLKVLKTIKKLRIDKNTGRRHLENHMKKVCTKFMTLRPLEWCKREIIVELFAKVVQSVFQPFKFQKVIKKFESRKTLKDAT